VLIISERVAPPLMLNDFAGPSLRHPLSTNVGRPKGGPYEIQTRRHMKLASAEMPARADCSPDNYVNRTHPLPLFLYVLQIKDLRAQVAYVLQMQDLKSRIFNHLRTWR
jgi:hypothetical protein